MPAYIPYEYLEQKEQETLLNGLAGQKNLFQNFFSLDKSKLSNLVYKYDNIIK